MNFASYTTSEYFPIFLTFYDSIKNNKNLNLHVLCLDKKVKKLVYEYNVKCEIIELSEIENFSQKILKKRYKNISEKIGVYRLAFIDYLLRKKKQSFHLIDSDTYFFSKIEDLKHELEDSNTSVAFCEHNFYYNKKTMCDHYGIYNAGYIYFNYDKVSLQFLNKYRNLCENYISWEIKKNSKNIFADQTYLENLLYDFKNIKIIKNSGINCAPWNIGNYELSFTNEKYFVDKKKLIFYHFSGIRPVLNKIFFFNLYHYNHRKLDMVRKTIYKIYLKNLQKNFQIYQTDKVSKKLNFKNIISLLKKIYRKDFLII